MTIPAPVTQADRLTTIDTLRGFALLGILCMNIPTFGLPLAAYTNFHVWGGDDPANVWTMVIVYLLGEGKMRAIFSMMFGASALLLISRGEKRGAGLDVADIYTRRTMWLMLFGMIHGYLIWWGDILFPYGLLGLLLLPFRKMSAKGLLIIATVLISLMSAGMIADSFDNRSEYRKYQQVVKVEKTGAKLNKEDTDLKKKWDERLDSKKRMEKVHAEIKGYRGNYAENTKVRAKQVWKFHSLPIYFPFMWDVLAMMFVGMAFFKSGVLTGERSYAFYTKMAVIGSVIGLAINGATMYFTLKHDFDPRRDFFDSVGYEFGRIPMSLAYVAILVMLVKAGKAPGVTSKLANVGQMAFSNYIATSLICSTIFYGGYGFGMFGKLNRWQLYIVVLCVWIFNIVWSAWWLKRYHYGPLEWCWRSLTYWKRPPFRIRPAIDLEAPPPPVTELIAGPSEVPVAAGDAAEENQGRAVQ